MYHITIGNNQIGVTGVKLLIYNAQVLMNLHTFELSTNCNYIYYLGGNSINKSSKTKLSLQIQQINNNNMQLLL